MTTAVSVHAAAPDTTLSIMTYWKINRRDHFLRSCRQIKERAMRDRGVKYYGFAVSGDEAVCKEGHASVGSFLAHLRNVEGHFFEAMSAASITNMEAHGPQSEVDLLRDTLKDLLASYWAYVDGAFFVPTKYVASGRMASDETLCVLVYWKTHDFKQFLSGVVDFQSLTKKEEKVKYYGFAVSGEHAICREGYDCADGFLEHLQNVDVPLKSAMQAAAIVRVEVHGPTAEVDKLREPLRTFPATFWGYPPDAFYVPAEYRASVQSN